MIQEKNSNAKQMTVSDEREELKYDYEMMDQYETEYSKELGSENYIKRMQEIAKKYKLPIICPSADSKDPSFILNGCFERFKGPDRRTLFTNSYRNIPMFFYKPSYRWYLGQQDYRWDLDSNYEGDLKLDNIWYLLKQEEGWRLGQEKGPEYFFMKFF